MKKRLCLLLALAAWGCSSSVDLLTIASLSRPFGLSACRPPEGEEVVADTITVFPENESFFEDHGMRVVDVAGPLRLEIRTAGEFEPVVLGRVYPLTASIRVIVTGYAPEAGFDLAIAAARRNDTIAALFRGVAPVVETVTSVSVVIGDICDPAARPQVALDGSGSGMIVYERGGTIEAQRYVGHAFEEPVVVDPAPGASAPDVAMDDDGNAIAVWLREFGGGRAVFASVFRSDTGQWSEPVGLDPTGGGLEPDLGDGAQPERPQVSLARDGSGLVAWARGGAIVGRRIESLVFLASELTLHQEEAEYRRPRVAVNAAGELGLVVWESAGAGTTFVLAVEAPPLGTVGPIMQFGEPGVSGVDLAMAGELAAAVYTDADGVLARRFVDGIWRAPERVELGEATAPRVAVNADGDVFVSYDLAGAVFVSERTVDFFEFPTRIGESGARSGIATSGDIAYVLAPGAGMSAARRGQGLWAEARPIGAGEVGESDVAMDESGTCIAAWTTGGVLQRFVWALPVAAFTHDPVVAGEPVTVDASPSYARTTNAGVAEYFWTFGDEDHATAQALERTFTASQTVKLTVTDGWGNRGTVEQEIEVDPGDDTVTLTIEFHGSGTGQVFVPFGQTTCTQTCTVQLPRGTQHFLHQTADPGYVFSQWIGCDAIADGNGCIVTMDTDRTVQVLFD